MKGIIAIFCCFILAAAVSTEVFSLDEQATTSSDHPKTIAEGNTFGTLTDQPDKSFKAGCRCVKKVDGAYTQGISICNTGCGNPTKVCDSTFGCGENERKCDASKCTCIPNGIPDNSDRLTHVQCSEQCAKLGMEIPTDEAGVKAARNTGCNFNKKPIWASAGPATDPPTSPPTNPPTNPPTDPPTNPPTNPPTDPPTNPPTDPPTNPPTNPPCPTVTQQSQSEGCKTQCNVMLSGWIHAASGGGSARIGKKKSAQACFDLCKTKDAGNGKTATCSRTAAGTCYFKTVDTPNDKSTLIKADTRRDAVVKDRYVAVMC